MIGSTTLSYVSGKDRSRLKFTYQSTVDTSLLRARITREIDLAVARWMESRVVYGVDDCALAVADILKPCFGYDPMKQFRGRYKTARGYRRMLRNDGFDSIDAALVVAAVNFGWRRIDPKEAEPGDIGVTAHYDGRTLAICAGHFWYARRDFGCGTKVASEIDVAYAVLG